jgi:hypothetical protein
MDIDTALGMLGKLPVIITEAEIRHERDRISDESSTCQMLRREITSRFRETARQLVNDTGIDDLEFQMIMSRLAYDDVRTLCQVQLAENEGK